MVKKCMMREKPKDVEVEALPEGGQYVKLHKNAAEVDIPATGEGDPGKAWECDEATFRLEPGQEATAAAVKKEFDSWWEYGAAWEAAQAEPSLEDRVALLEVAFLASVTG